MATIQERIGADGKKRYRVMIRRKGAPTITATFDRKTDAKEWAIKEESNVKDKRYFKSKEAQKKTLSDAFTRYLDRVAKQNPKRLRDVKTMLEWWDKEIGYAFIGDVTRSLVHEKVEKLTSKTYQKKSDGRDYTIGASRVNRYILALSHVFTIMVNEWEWLEIHPLQRIRKLPEPRGRVRFLDDDERQRLLDACQASRYKHLYLVVVLALSTGARKNELMTLEWKDVGFTTGQIILHQTKNGERRVLPLAGRAMHLMREHHKDRRLDTPLVFPSDLNPAKPFDIRASWEAALQKSKIDDFRFHDLRHSAASYLAMNGATPNEIAEVLGHKTLQMVKRYAHLSEAHTSSVVASMNERIFG